MPERPIAKSRPFEKVELSPDESSSEEPGDDPAIGKPTRRIRPPEAERELTDEPVVGKPTRRIRAPEVEK